MSGAETILIRGRDIPLIALWRDHQGRIAIIRSNEAGPEVVVLPEHKRVAARVFLVEDDIAYAVAGDSVPTDEDWAWAPHEAMKRRTVKEDK